MQKESIDKLKEAVKQSAVKAVVDTAQSTYGSDMKVVDKRQIESKLNHEADRMIDKLHTNYEIERNVIENQRVAEQQARYETGKTSEQIDKEFEQKQKVAMEKFNEELTTAISDFAKESTKETVKTIETKKKEREKETIEDGVRDHLRGFSRTIPSFLMTYGDNTVTRLKHIFEKQVYGLAPTEIIYKIATSYILGFDADTKDIKHNFRQLDALPYAKEGTLEQLLNELYPEQQ